MEVGDLQYRSALYIRALTDAGAGGLITDASASQTFGTASLCINPGNSGCEFVLAAGKTARCSPPIRLSARGALDGRHPCW